MHYFNAMLPATTGETSLVNKAFFFSFFFICLASRRFRADLSTRWCAEWFRKFFVHAVRARPLFLSGDAHPWKHIDTVSRSIFLCFFLFFLVKYEDGSSVEDFEAIRWRRYLFHSFFCFRPEKTPRTQRRCSSIRNIWKPWLRNWRKRVSQLKLSRDTWPLYFRYWVKQLQCTREK